MKEMNLLAYLSIPILGFCFYSVYNILAENRTKVIRKMRDKINRHMLCCENESAYVIDMEKHV